MITNNITDLIGDTPLIKLKYPSDTTHEEVFIVWTDGQDNGSARTIVDQNKYIRSLRTRGVTCIWSASSQDAVTTGTQGGFDPNHCLQVPTIQQRNAATMRGAPAPPSLGRGISAAVRGVSSGQNVDFSQMNRSPSVPTNSFSRLPMRPTMARRGMTSGQAPMSPIANVYRPNARRGVSSGIVPPPANMLPTPPANLFTGAGAPATNSFASVVPPPPPLVSAPSARVVPPPPSSPINSPPTLQTISRSSN